MLKLCVGTSLVHTMRTVSQSQAGHFGRNAKAALRDALYKVLGVERAEQGRLATETLMFLPGDQGGVGPLCGVRGCVAPNRRLSRAAFFRVVPR